MITVCEILECIIAYFAHWSCTGSFARTTVTLAVPDLWFATCSLILLLHNYFICFATHRLNQNQVWWKAKLMPMPTQSSTHPSESMLVAINRWAVLRSKMMSKPLQGQGEGKEEQKEPLFLETFPFILSMMFLGWDPSIANPGHLLWLLPLPA